MNLFGGMQLVGDIEGAATDDDAVVTVEGWKDILCAIQLHLGEFVAAQPCGLRKSLYPARQHRHRCAATLKGMKTCRISYLSLISALLWGELVLTHSTLSQPQNVPEEIRIFSHRQSRDKPVRIVSRNARWTSTPCASR